MLFKTPSLGAQWAGLHPALRVVVGDLDDVLEAWKLPTLTITDALRTAEEQEELYWKEYFGRTEKEARRLARAKFSWHLAGCAVDFRGSKPWGDEREKNIYQWLKQQCQRPLWELLRHNIGHGLHFHVAYRDFGWRRRWEQRHTGTV